MNLPFPQWPSFSQEEADAARSVLLSNAVNYWTGDECREFEKEFADWSGVTHAIAVTNGSFALEAALRAAGIGPGDDVIVTPRTFIASASAIVIAGARPIFADVDVNTQNITAESVAAVLTPQTRAVVCVHLAGMPCDMDPIISLAEQHQLVLIEDCAQAHGARYKGRSVGAIGHIGVWSFCQDKIMTTGGEGGMITTNDPDLWSRVWSYKDHGKSWQAVYEREHAPGFRWVHDSIGTNGRMLEMQAAIGRIQLERMRDWSAIRRQNARQIWKCARSLPGLRVPEIPDWADHAAYKCYVFVDTDAISADWSRDRIMQAVNARGVPCFSGSCAEVYREKAFTDRNLGPADRLPVAQELGRTSLMFLVHPTLTAEHIDLACGVLHEVMAAAVKS